MCVHPSICLPPVRSPQAAPAAAEAPSQSPRRRTRNTSSLPLASRRRRAIPAGEPEPPRRANATQLLVCLLLCLWRATARFIANQVPCEKPWRLPNSCEGKGQGSPYYCPSCGSFVQRCCSIDLDQGAVDPLLDRLSVRCGCCAVRPVTPSVGARGSSGGADGVAAVRHDDRGVLDACCTALVVGHGRPERRGQRAVTTESDASSETQLSTPNRGARGCCTGHSLLAGGGPFGSCGRSAGFGLRRTSRARDPPRTARMAALRWTGGTLAALAALSGAHAQVCAATTPVPLGCPPPTLPQLPPHILSVAPRARAARCAKRYAHCGPRCAAVRRFATTATRTAAVC